MKSVQRKEAHALASALSDGKVMAKLSALATPYLVASFPIRALALSGAQHALAAARAVQEAGAAVRLPLVAECALLVCLIEAPLVSRICSLQHTHSCSYDLHAFVSMRSAGSWLIASAVNTDIMMMHATAMPHMACTCRQPDSLNLCQIDYRPGTCVIHVMHLEGST